MDDADKQKSIYSDPILYIQHFVIEVCDHPKQLDGADEKLALSLAEVQALTENDLEKISTLYIEKNQFFQNVTEEKPGEITVSIGPAPPPFPRLEGESSRNYLVRLLEEERESISSMTRSIGNGFSRTLKQQMANTVLLGQKLSASLSRPNEPDFSSLNSTSEISNQSRRLEELT